jgi:hypothetical protein
MNRRDFFKSTGLSLAGIPFLKWSALADNFKSDSPLYDQFDWVNTPVGLTFRIENERIVSLPFVCKTIRLKIVTHKDNDLSKQYFSQCRSGNVGFYTCYIKNFHIQKIWTNKHLLKECLKLKLTHIYTIMQSPPLCLGSDQVSYYVRGAKLPGWKTENGKLKVVNL